MIRLSAGVASTIAAAIGVTLWLATVGMTGRVEAWDAAEYWTIAYPIAIVAAAVLGYLTPENAWRWGLIVMVVQAVTMVVRGREFSLLPLGLILFAVLAIPPMLGAWAAAAVRRNVDRRSNIPPSHSPS